MSAAANFGSRFRFLFGPSFTDAYRVKNYRTIYFSSHFGVQQMAVF